MSEALLPFLRFAEMIESLFVTCYKTFRFASPLGAATFYIYLFGFLYLLTRCCRKKKEKVFYTVVEEGEGSAILLSLKKKNEEILRNVEDYMKRLEKNEGLPSSLLNSVKDLKEVEEMYSEFSEEILDSHNSIRDSLILPVMK
jgi:vacuolar-type H+-ATPase subunit I/STV1